MTLQRLQMDMKRPPRRRATAGLLMLAAGVLALAAALAWIDASARALTRAQAEIDLQLERIGKSKSRRGAGPAVDPRDQRAERAVRAMLADLATPWDGLLGALEAVQRPDVALLVIEPNAAERKVRLQLEARHADAMLAYLDSLQADPRLAGVMLQTHQPASDATAGAVRFHIAASWGARR